MSPSQLPASMRVVIAILVLASAVSIMSTDLYTPSLPFLREYFGTSAEMVKLTVTLNLLAFGFSQLFLGPISDRYGRRPVMLMGLACFVAFGLACAGARSIGQLIVARVFLGLAAAVEAVIGLAVLRDLLDEKERVKAFAIWGMAIAVAPGAAPIIGGYVHVIFGWRANFILVALMGVLVWVAIWRWLPESGTRDPNALAPGPVLRGYARLLSDRRFIGNAMMMGVGMGCIYAFITAAPFILIDQHRVAVQHFGYYQAVIVAAFFIGSLVANRLVGTMDLDRLLGLGIAVVAGGVLSLPAFIAVDAFTPATFTFGMSLVTGGLGPVFAISPARALDHISERIGSASALIGAIEIGVGGVAAASVTIFHDGTEKPLVFTMLGLGLGGAVAWRSLRFGPSRRITGRA